VQFFAYLTLVGYDSGGDKVEIFAESSMSSVLILTRQVAITNHIRVQDGRELARQTVSHAGWSL
jgi:hypothetical protein